MKKTPVYDSSHVLISNRIAREFNNPLGAAALTLLRHLLPQTGSFRVLDAGCGKGAASSYWARSGAAAIHAFDPSEDMLQTARETLSRTAPAACTVTFENATLESFHTEEQYDIIVLHDVLCYTANPLKTAEKFLNYLKPGGIASISDYWNDKSSTAVDRITKAWNISKPVQFHAWDAVPEGYKQLLHADTTRQYSEHWQECRNKVEQLRETLIAEAGKNPVHDYEAKIQSIQSAVATGSFGHHWLLIAKT